MYYISCIFNDETHKPYIAAIYNSTNKKIEFYKLFYPNSNQKLFDAYNNCNIIKDIIQKNKVVLSNFKQFLKGFEFNLNRYYDVYDVCLDNPQYSNSISKDKTNLVQSILSMTKCGIEEWQNIYALSQIAYYYLEKNGLYCNGKKIYPKYESTYSGRSKCKIHNMYNDTYDICHRNYEYDYYICLDWIAADLNIIGILSKDEELLRSFDNNDPYIDMCNKLNLDSSYRNDCKREFFRALYSAEYNADIIKCYKNVPKWMNKSITDITKNGYSRSILGRKFCLDDNRDIKSAFNAKIQGSVAHAMQSTIYRTYKLFPDNILCEVHDSLILCCNKNDMKSIITEIVNIMMYPFEDILDDNYKFPVKISIGNQWKKFRQFREYR